VDLRALDDEWLPLPEVANRLGLQPREVRALVRDQRLVGTRLEGVEGYRVPGSFLVGDRLVDGLRGSIIQLRDAGMDDTAIVEWLLSPHAELGEAPIRALEAGRTHAVRRAAIAD